MIRIGASYLPTVVLNEAAINVLNDLISKKHPLPLLMIGRLNLCSNQIEICDLDYGIEEQEIIRPTNIKNDEIAIPLKFIDKLDLEFDQGKIDDILELYQSVTDEVPNQLFKLACLASKFKNNLVFQFFLPFPNMSIGFTDIGMARVPYPDHDKTLRYTIDIRDGIVTSVFYGTKNTSDYIAYLFASILSYQYPETEIHAIIGNRIYNIESQIENHSMYFVTLGCTGFTEIGTLCRIKMKSHPLQAHLNSINQRFTTLQSNMDSFKEEVTSYVSDQLKSQMAELKKTILSIKPISPTAVVQSPVVVSSSDSEGNQPHFFIAKNRKTKSTPNVRPPETMISRQTKETPQMTQKKVKQPITTPNSGIFNESPPVDTKRSSDSYQKAPSVFSAQQPKHDFMAAPENYSNQSYERETFFQPQETKQQSEKRAPPRSEPGYAVPNIDVDENRPYAPTRRSGFNKGIDLDSDVLKSDDSKQGFKFEDPSSQSRYRTSGKYTGRSSNGIETPSTSSRLDYDQLMRQGTSSSRASRRSERENSTSISQSARKSRYDNEPSWSHSSESNRHKNSMRGGIDFSMAPMPSDESRNHDSRKSSRRSTRFDESTREMMKSTKSRNAATNNDIDTEMEFSKSTKKLLDMLNIDTI